MIRLATSRWCLQKDDGQTFLNQRDLELHYHVDSSRLSVPSLGIQTRLSRGS